MRVPKVGCAILGYLRCTDGTDMLDWGAGVVRPCCASGRDVQGGNSGKQRTGGRQKRKLRRKNPIWEGHGACLQVCQGPCGLSETQQASTRERKRMLSSISVGIFHARPSEKRTTGGGSTRTFPTGQAKSDAIGRTRLAGRRSYGR